MIVQGQNIFIDDTRLLHAVLQLNHKQSSLYLQARINPLQLPYNSLAGPYVASAALPVKNCCKRNVNLPLF